MCGSVAVAIMLGASPEELAVSRYSYAAAVRSPRLERAIRAAVAASIGGLIGVVVGGLSVLGVVVAVTKSPDPESHAATRASAAPVGVAQAPQTTWPDAVSSQRQQPGDSGSGPAKPVRKVDDAATAGAPASAKSVDHDERPATTAAGDSSRIAPAPARAGEVPTAAAGNAADEPAASAQTISAHAKPSAVARSRVAQPAPPGQPAPLPATRAAAGERAEQRPLYDSYDQPRGYRAFEQDRSNDAAPQGDRDASRDPGDPRDPRKSRLARRQRLPTVDRSGPLPLDPPQRVIVPPDQGPPPGQWGSLFDLFGNNRDWR